ncbi:MAG: hypothetical protein RIB84_23955 [Sneathiellaceae bacterium]
MTLPRGIRNRNPGNIELGADWLGLSRDQQDGRFAQFTGVEFGIRAMARILRNYQRHHQLRSVREMIGRWAPAGENDSATYAEQVARWMGLRPNHHVDLQDDQVLAGMIEGMIRHENGAPGAADLHKLYPGGLPDGLAPGAWYPRATILSGIAMESGR